MANTFRYRWGETNPVEAPVRATEAIEIGDLLFMEPTDGYARPASSIVDLGSLGANQQYFACRFLGVAAQAHRASHDPADPSTIRVNTDGVFEYVCAALAAALHLGQLFGVDENAAGTALMDQQVEQVGVTVTNLEQVIARLAKPAITGDTKVFIKIASVVMDNGIQQAQICSASSSSSGA